MKTAIIFFTMLVTCFASSFASAEEARISGIYRLSAPCALDLDGLNIKTLPAGQVAVVENVPAFNEGMGETPSVVLASGPALANVIQMKVGNNCSFRFGERCEKIGTYSNDRRSFVQTYEQDSITLRKLANNLELTVKNQRTGETTCQLTPAL
jgi:hypothetical protein